MTPDLAKQPIVIVPGIQGRWEWMAPAIQELSRRFDVRTFSLNEVRGYREPGTGRHTYFDAWHQRIDRLLADTPDPCPLIGVSFGGLIAATYAASRLDRVSHLILVSSPSPGFRLDSRQSGYTRRPVLSLPLFAVRGVGRLAPEVTAGLPSWPQRLLFAATYGFRALRYPVSSRLMAAWAREWMDRDFSDAWPRITVPTLVITGESSLDRVVPVSSSLEYLRLIRSARHAVLPATGHVGYLMKPQVFAERVGEFVGH